MGCAWHARAGALVPDACNLNLNLNHGLRTHARSSTRTAAGDAVAGGSTPDAGLRGAIAAYNLEAAPRVA